MAYNLVQATDLDLSYRPDDFTHLGESTGTTLSFSRVNTTDDFCACAELVAKEFAWRGYLHGTVEDQIEILKEYEEDEQSVFAAKENEVVVATLSVALEKASRSLPMFQIFPEVKEFRVGGLGQIGNLAADRRHGNEAFLPLMCLGIMQIIKNGLQNICMTINPRHVLFYERKIGFRTLASGQKRYHPKVNKAPAVGMVLEDASHARDRSPFVRANLLRYTPIWEKVLQ